jgi:hypothetical protein
MSEIGFGASLNKDYGNATDIGYRWTNGAIAAVRIYKQDAPLVAAEKLRELAHAIESVHGMGAQVPPNNQVERP